VLVLEGEKARVITYTLSGATATGPGQGQPPAQAPSDTGSSWNGTKTAAVVVGGVGVVSLAVGIIFGAMGSSGTSCKPNCTDDQVSSIKSNLVLSDIFIPVSIVGLAGGVVLYLVSGGSTHASASSTTGLNISHGVRLDASPTKDGATFGLHGSF
jgi:hypothetical protein